MGVTVVKGIVILEQGLMHCSTAWAFEKGILHHFKDGKHSTCREGSSGLLAVYIGTSRCDNDPKKMMEVDACFTMIDALSVDQSYICVVFYLKMVADHSTTLQSPRPSNAFHFMCSQKMSTCICLSVNPHRALDETDCGMTSLVISRRHPKQQDSLWERQAILL